VRIFLAGASGVIGARLVPLLVAGGHAVAGMTRTPGNADRPPDDVNEIAGAAVRNTRIREEGTRNLLAGAAAAGCGRVIAQSIAWKLPPKRAAGIAAFEAAGARRRGSDHPLWPVLRPGDLLSASAAAPAAHPGERGGEGDG